MAGLVVTGCVLEFSCVGNEGDWGYRGTIILWGMCWTRTRGFEHGHTHLFQTLQSDVIRGLPMGCGYIRRLQLSFSLMMYKSTCNIGCDPTQHKFQIRAALLAM